MKKSKSTKKLLLYQLWDRFVSKHNKITSKVDVLRIKLKTETGKLGRKALLTELKEAPRSNLTVNQLKSVTPDDRKYYAERYFEMRYRDYLIQTYSRYGASASAQ